MRFVKIIFFFWSFLVAGSAEAYHLATTCGENASRPCAAGETPKEKKWPFGHADYAFVGEWPETFNLFNLHAAVESWNDAACSDFVFSLSPGPSGWYTILYQPDWTEDPAALGLTATYFRKDNGSIVKAETVVNGSSPWQNAEATSDVFHSLEAVVAHEAGHALGLAHSELQSAVMFAIQPANVQWRGLTDDDVGGVCALYPADEAPAAGSGCSDVTPIDKGWPSGSIIAILIAIAMTRRRNR